MTTESPRHVSFASLCSIIPEQAQQPPSTGIFGLHTKSISLSLSWPHPKRSNSESSVNDDPPTSPTTSNGTKSPTLVVRIPSFTTKPRHPSHSPTEATPPRSCIKHRNASFSSSTTTPPVRSPPQRQRSLSTPVETLPLRPCCTECEEPVLLARSLGSLYKVPWSNAAKAKKKRDDAEEQRDILAGLKEGCILKWAQLQDEEESQIEKGLLSPACAKVPSLSVCSSASSLDGSDPLSQLDGTHKSTKLRKKQHPNEDWAPSKYYDDDDEDDLFPLPSPSPKLTPPEGASPSSSFTNLPSPAAAQLSFPEGVSTTSPKSSNPSSCPPIAYSNHLGLGLPTIPSAPASRSASRSSVSSHSSHSSVQCSRPSPLRSDGLLNVDESSRHTRQASDGSYRSPPSVSSTQSSSSRGSSGRVWTSTFVPPPLPTKSTHSHRSTHSTSSVSKSPLTRPPGASPSPLLVASTTASLTKASSTRATPAVPAQPTAISERADPPYMPTYSGAQREVVVIKSSHSKKKDKGSSSKGSISNLNDDLPTPSEGSSTPRYETDSWNVPSATRSSDPARGRTVSNPSGPHKSSSAAPPRMRPEAREEASVTESSRSRQRSANRASLPADSNIHLYTSSAPLSRSAGASRDLTLNREGNAPLTTTRSPSISSRTSGNSSTRRRPSESENDDSKGGRTRSSSIRKMFKGISLGMGTAAGVVPVR